MKPSCSFGPLGRVLIVSLFLLTSRSVLAQAPTPTHCSDAFEESQRLSKAGKLQASLEQLVICGQPTCPSFLARECSSSYELIRSRLPTVNLLARDAHGPVTEVAVSMDGNALVERIEGVAVPVDPGLHEFAFESSGFKAAKVRIVIAEGQKNQLVVATLEPLPAAPPPVSPEKAAAPPPRPSRGIPTASYVLGGLGLVGLATGTTFRVMGSSAYGDLESRCGNACPPDDVDPVRTKFTVSTIGFGVGAAALLAAGVVLIVGGDAKAHEEKAVSTWSLRAAFTGHEAGALVEGSFN